MITIGFIIIYSILVGFGLYLFDYQVDSSINNPLVILGSFVIGLMISIILLLLFIEAMYYIYARGKPINDMKKHRIAKKIVSVAVHLFHIKISLTGKEYLPKDNRFLIYANHTSELDIPIMMNILKEFPIAFLAKEAVKNYLSIGKWAEEIGCVLLDRQNNRQGAIATNQVVEHVNSGSPMIVFPEGTIKRENGKLLKFRNGAFKIALESQVPIVPVTIVKDKNYLKYPWPYPRRFTIVVHPPIPYESYQTLKTKELSDAIRDIIKSELVWEE